MTESVIDLVLGIERCATELLSQPMHCSRMAVELSHAFLAEALHWACMAGRSREELEAAVKEDGTKMFDYIHVAPIRLRGE
jgi:hypothetical protein